MAEIRQELVLEDKFSRVLDDFMKRLENIEKVQDRLAEQATEQNKHSEEMNSKFDRLNNTALRLANNGLQQLQRRLIALGVSFIGARALYMSFMGAVNDYDMNIRFNNRSNVSGDINGYSRQLAMQYGGNASEYNQITANMSRYTNTSQMSRMQSLGARLASITPNMSVAEGMNAVNSAMYNRSGTSLINQFGLNADRSERHQVDILLQQGRLDEALNIIERLSEQAGATEKSLNNMLDSPLIRIQKFKAQLDNIRKTIGDELLNALKPVMDAFDRLFKSEEFKRFVSIIGNVFRVLGQTVADVVNYIVDNWDKISQTIKRVLPYLGIALGLLGLYKVLMITIPPIMLAVKGAITLVTAAQWVLNTAMTANPVGAVVAALVALLAILTAVTGKFDKAHGPFIRFLGVLAMVGTTIKNIIGGMWNNVANPIQLIIKNIAVLINTIMLLKNPVVAIQYFFKSMFVNIAEFATGIVKNIAEKIYTVGQLLQKFKLGEGIGQKMVSVGEGLYSLADRYDVDAERKKITDWLEANGMKEFIDTSFELPRVNIEDPIQAYKDMTNWAQGLKDKFTSLGEKIDEGTKAQIAGNNEMKNLGNVIDKQTWMDKFNFATTDMERNAVNSVNSSYVGGNMNVVFNGNMDVEEATEKLRKTWEGFKKQEEQYAKNGIVLSDAPAGA